MCAIVVRLLAIMPAGWNTEETRILVSTGGKNLVLEIEKLRVCDSMQELLNQSTQLMWRGFSNIPVWMQVKPAFAGERAANQFVVYAYTLLITDVE